MKNEPDLNELWPTIRECGAASLRPDVAGRVFERLAAARGELTTPTTILVGLGTAMACLMLTIAFNFWSEHRSTNAALAEWGEMASENATLEQESTL